ncbi:MAG: TRAP transporter small permease [Paracoccaceae bacterium]
MKFLGLARAIERALDVFLLIAISMMLVSICIQVAGRYLFGYAPSWTEEVARFLVIWVTMVGSAVMLRRGGHIAVTVAVDALPRRLGLAVGWLRDALILIMAGALAYYGYMFAVIGGRRDSAALEIPMYYPYLAIPVGAALIALLLTLSRAGRLAGEPEA